MKRRFAEMREFSIGFECDARHIPAHIEAQSANCGPLMKEYKLIEVGNTKRMQIRQDLTIVNQVAI
jgi:hypothetical protein